MLGWQNHSGQYEHMLCSPSLIYLFSCWNSQATVGNPSLFTTPELVCRSGNSTSASTSTGWVTDHIILSCVQQVSLHSPIVHKCLLNSEKCYAMHSISNKIHSLRTHEPRSHFFFFRLRNETKPAGCDTGAASLSRNVLFTSEKQRNISRGSTLICYERTYFVQPE